ncbi:MAG: hypothetical protein HY246_01120 [Proteobacteria bacterium]|nr:hypothetical protein [Pseudomonadota bacterium]
MTGAVLVHRLMPLAAAIAPLLVAACGNSDTNFSQYPGFAEYFAANPRTQVLPTPAERALLEQHRPRLFLPPGNPGLIDFYGDYVAQGALNDAQGNLVSDRVTQDLLNRYRDDPHALFIHHPATAPVRPTVYARVDRETVASPGGAPEVFTFLTYNAVFRVSGLPAGMSSWQEFFLGLVASLDDWHQLDHYTAATLVLDGAQRPAALMMQQHNLVRTYLIGRDVELPADGRPLIDIAIRSNEFYPHALGQVRRRAAPMPTIAGIRYLISGQGQPAFEADDITDGVTEATYGLAYLPHDDAFYAFQGWLGERRRLPGRSGPPGADYNTIPDLKRRSAQMFAGYFREGSAADLAHLDATGADGRSHVDGRFARLQAETFFRDRACVAQNIAAC